MRITVCGTGAMACLFGARLAEVADVTLVGTWAEGIAAINDRGIQVEGGAAVPPGGIAAAPLGNPVAPADLLLVLVKTWQTRRVAGHLAALIRPGAIVLTLQNGLGNLEALGPEACLGTTAEGATLLGPGQVRWGGGGPTYAAAPAWVVSVLRQARFEAHLCEKVQAHSLLWGKLTANCGINALTALLRVPNGGLLGSPEAAVLMERAARECAEVARAKGIRLPFDDPAAHVRDVARCTAGNLSSMLQDVLRGAPTECDALNGAVLREAGLFGIPTPVNEMLWLLVKAAVSTGASGDGCRR